MHETDETKDKHSTTEGELHFDENDKKIVSVETPYIYHNLM